MSFKDAVEAVGKALDGIGVAALIVGLVVALVLTLRDQPVSAHHRYRAFRTRIGRAILLGLELLVAADIIRTVAVTPTIRSAAVLGIVVMIRTFLSFSLEVELEGRWPWKARQPDDSPRTPGGRS